MLIHNKFTKDNDLERTERLISIFNHIDDYSSEFGLAADKITWAHNAYNIWHAAVINADADQAEGEGAYMALRIAEQSGAKFYCKAKALLKAILSGRGDSDELFEEYGLKGKSARGYKRLIAAIDVWKGTHDRLVSEGDDRVLPDAIVAKMVEHREELDELWHKAIDEKTEAREARRVKKELFDRDTKMLAYLFALCKLHWGIQEPKLMGLGFVQKSAIWTFKKKEEEEVPE